MQFRTDILDPDKGISDFTHVQTTRLKRNPLSGIYVGEILKADSIGIELYSPS